MGSKQLLVIVTCVVLVFGQLASSVSRFGDVKDLKPGWIRTCIDKDAKELPVKYNATVSYDPPNITAGVTYTIQAGATSDSGTVFSDGTLILTVALFKDPDDPFIDVTQNATCHDLLSLFSDGKDYIPIPGPLPLKIKCPFHPISFAYPFFQTPYKTPDRDHFYFPQGDYIFQIRLDQDSSPYLCIEGRVNVLNSEMEFPNFDQLETNEHEVPGNHEPIKSYLSTL